jgi:nucleolar complex protein 3
LGSTKKKARAVPKKEKAAHRPTIPIPHDEQSDESDEEPWDSDIENFQIQLGTTLGETSGAEDASIGSGSSSSAVNVEEVYERSQAMKKVDVKENHRGPERLPVKLPGGKVEKRGYLSANDTLEKDEESDLEESAVLPTPEPPRDDISTGARFGRPAVVSILQNKSRKVRILAAKEQLASICQEILADPENSVRRTSHLLDEFQCPHVSCIV